MKASIREKDIPATLKKLDRWALWKFIPGDKKPRKIPIKLNGRAASATSPDDFTSFAGVCQSRTIKGKNIEGLAFALFESDDITVFDFDNFNSLSPRQQTQIMSLCETTYSEWSQSKNGIHCFFKGHDARIERKKFKWNGLPVEIYRYDRFIAVTGNRVERCPKRLAKYSKNEVDEILGALPHEATQPAMGVSHEAAGELMAADPVHTIDHVLAAIERDSQHDAKDAGPVHEWLESGYGAGDDMSSNDLILCKVLWKYGAVYSQIEEIISAHNPRGDNKWERDDYRTSTIVKAYSSAGGDGFENEGPATDKPKAAASEGKKPNTKNKKKQFRKRMKSLRKKLNKHLEEYNELTARMSAGRVAERAVDRIQERIEALQRKCYSVAGQLNSLDVERLNQYYGEVVIGSEIRVGAYYNGKKRLLRWDSFEKIMRSQHEAVRLKERAPRGRAESGALIVESIQSADHWLAHPDHRRFPLEPELMPSPELLCSDKGFKEEDDGKPFNLFEGCQFRPEKTEVSHLPIVHHIHNVWASGDTKTTEYILNWMARMVQEPHRVGQTAIVLRSIEGVGKNIITNIFKRYYGTHAVDITDMDSIRGFNAMPMRAVLTVFNEATYGGNKKTAGALKAMVTDDYLTSQEKYQPSITHRNCSHILIFSNNEWIVPVGLDDRRFLILECDSSHMVTGSETKEQYFRGLIEDCIHKGGDRTFLRFLLDKDISKFNPRDIPNQRTSEAHMEQTIRGLNGMQKWIIECAERGAIPLSSGIVIEWRKSKATKISVPDLRDSFLSSEFGKRDHEAPSEMLYGLARKLSTILQVDVRDVRNVKSRSVTGRGRGVELPSLKFVRESCRFLHKN